MTVSQADFVGALLDPDIAAPEGLQDPNGRPAGKRFDVYRNTVVLSLIKAMETAFPVVRNLVGEVAFQELSSIYVRKYPPKSPMLMLYGADFPHFLQTIEYVNPKPYLSDIARLELAYRQCYHSADLPPIVANDLAQISPENLISLKLKLAPMVHIITSKYSVLSLWNSEISDESDLVKTNPETVLLTRRKFDVNLQCIDTATSDFLSSLISETLGGAFDAAKKIDADFDLTTGISLLLNQNMIVEISM
jgi:hypothetical protein